MYYEELKERFVEEKFEKDEESGIISLSRNIQRKESNIDAFSNLKIPMKKRKVKEISKLYDVDLTGLTIKIRRSEKFLSLSMAGSTNYKNVGRIDLFHNAFEEQLVRTLIHEKVHVQQLKKYGFKYAQEHLAEMEEEAYAFENF